MNKKRSNEYGFTLIELLIAIAIMLSITVLAIVNIVGVSNRKKEEAWQSVKEEIETAATDYFKANEYLFEGLGENENNGYISVGKLVNDDYLNKVTDPRSGKAVSYCTLVYIKKSGRSVSVTKIEETLESNCDYESVVTVSNAKNAPKLKVNKKCGKNGNNGWCIGDTKPKVEAIATPVNGSEVISIEKDNNTGSNYKCDANLTSSNNDKKKSCTLQKETKEGITLIAKSVDGGIAKSTIDIGYDKTAPVVNLTIETKSNNKNFKTKNTKISAVVTETLSHVASVKSTVDGKEKKDIFNDTSNYYKDTFDLTNNDYPLFEEYLGSSKTVGVEATDNAGNKGSSSRSYTVYKECQTEFTSTTDITTKKCPSLNCSNSNETETVKTITTDNYTNKECSTKTSYNDCNLKKCCPKFTYEEYNKKYDHNPNPNAWYTKVDVKYDGDSNYWSWNNNSCKGKTCTINSLGKDKTVTLNGQKGESCPSKKVNIYKEFDCSSNITITPTSEAVVFKINSNKINGEFGFTINSNSDKYLYSGSSVKQMAIKNFDEKATQYMKYKLNGYDKNNISFECSGTIERPINPPVCPTNPDSIISGIKGNNGWYKSDVTIKFNGHSSVKEYYWITSHNGNENKIENKDLDIKDEGTTAYMLYVSNGYKTISCGSWKYINIDKNAPKFNKIISDAYYDSYYTEQKVDSPLGYNIPKNVENAVLAYSWNPSGRLRLLGFASVNNGNINVCVPNYVNGASGIGYKVSYTDTISGVDLSSYSSSYSLDEGNSDGYCKRSRSMCTGYIKAQVCDYAGNCTDNTNVATVYTTYILTEGHRNTTPSCNVDNYRNRFFANPNNKDKKGSIIKGLIYDYFYTDGKYNGNLPNTNP